MEVGADDYVVKPFSPQKVIFCVKAILRRSSAPAFPRKETVSSNTIVFPHVIIDQDAQFEEGGEYKYE